MDEHEHLRKEIRSGQSSFRMEGVILATQNGKLRGAGVLRIADRIQFELDLTRKSLPPTFKSGVYTQKDFWSISGRIRNGLRFKARNVRFSSKGTNPFTKTIHLECDLLTLLPQGLNSLTAKDRLKEMERVVGGAKFHPSFGVAPRAEFHAIIYKSKLAVTNASSTEKWTNPYLGWKEQDHQDTYIQRTKDFDFALIERDRDLHVYCRSKAKNSKLPTAPDKRFFDALLEAVGFTHGIQPWPYWQIYLRNGAEREIIIRAPVERMSTRHKPLSSPIRSIGGESILLMARFFEKDEPIVSKVENLLYYLREAGLAKMHWHLETMILCSLFEGLIDACYKEFGMEEKLKAEDPELAEFVAARDQLVAHIGAGGNQSSGKKRIIKVLKGAALIFFPQKFQAVVKHLGLAGQLDRHFDAWNAERNPLMHGRIGKFDEGIFERQKLIGTAINSIVLRLAGDTNLSDHLLKS